MSIYTRHSDNFLSFLSKKNETMTLDVSETPTDITENIKLINTIEAFYALKDIWNELNCDSSTGTVFSSWDWLYTWWEIYQSEGNRQLYIVNCYNNDNELIGIAPFQIIHNPKKYFPCSRQLIMLGTGETDGSSIFGEYMDLIVKPGYEVFFSTHLSNYLFKMRHLWDGVKFYQLLADNHLERLFESNNDDDFQCFEKNITQNGFRTIIDLPATYKDYLMTLRKKMRNNITRLYKRLETEQAFIIEEVTVESEAKAREEGLPTAIEVLTQLNLSRRGFLHKKSVFSHANFVKYHKRLLERLLETNQISFKIMRIEGEPVAALYSFIDRGTVHAYQSGFEAEIGHRYSLLTTMLTQEINSQIDRKDSYRFNFMYDDNEDTYKKRFSGQSENMFNIAFEKKGIKSSIYKIIHRTIKPKVIQLLKM